MIILSDKFLNTSLGVGVAEKVLLTVLIDCYRSDGRVICSVEGIAKRLGCTGKEAERLATNLYKTNLITGIKHLNTKNGEEQYEFVLNKTFLKNRFPKMFASPCP